MGTHTHSLHHGPVWNVWKLWLAELGVVLPECLGAYYAASLWRQGEIDLGLLALGCSAGVATVYAFGYLWCLPDVLGGMPHDQTRNLRQRWSDFALLTAFIGILVIAGAYIRVIWEYFSYVDLARALAILLACFWLLPACVVASEKYLGWTMPGGEAKEGMGWRVRVRGATRKWGHWLVRLLGAKGALGGGGVLALSSLILEFETGRGGGYTGYKIVAEKDVWPRVTHVEPILYSFLVQGHPWVYVLGLVVATLALAGVLPGRLGRIIRSSKTLATLAGIIALLQVTAGAIRLLQIMAYETSASQPDKYRLALWILLWGALFILLWAVPVAIWLRGMRGSRESWDHTRLAVMVFYLPIFLLGFSFFVVGTYFGLGFGGFVIGMLLVWWGLVQSRWEIAQQQDSARILAGCGFPR
ncbi:MAG: hypothetical protein LAO18_03305 [Acidobacteriia bacterium]|nr:hypothetical protein [Terriglobia bacterium]